MMCSARRCVLCAAYCKALVGVVPALSQAGALKLKSASIRRLSSWYSVEQREMFFRKVGLGAEQEKWLRGYLGTAGFARSVGHPFFGGEQRRIGTQPWVKFGEEAT